MALALRDGRADGAEELLEDRVEAADFVAGGGEAALEGLTLFWRQLTQLSVDQLQMDVDRVERVADFVGDARGQEREGVVAFRLEDFFGLGAGAGEVAEQYHITCRIERIEVVDWREVEIQKSVFRVKDLKVAAHGAARFAEHRPIKPPHFCGEPLADRGLGVDPQQAPCRAIHKSDHPFDIEQDHPLLHRLEDIFQKAVLTRQPRDDLLHLAVLDAV